MLSLRSPTMALLAAGALAFAPPVLAAPINTALSVVIDGSQDIDRADFENRVSAYSSVLGDAGILPADGTVVINFIQASGEGQIEQSALRISTETDRTTLLSSLGDMQQLGGPGDIQEGIHLGVDDMESYLGSDDLPEADLSSEISKLVHVSTGSIPESETSASTSGFTSSAEDEGGGEGDNGENEKAYEVSWATFEQPQSTLREQVGQDLQTVPNPAPLALLGIGLAGMGIIRRFAA